MSNFSSPFMFKSPLNDLRKANSSRKTKKREPMKDCEGFECSKSEASLNRENKTKTRTKTHIDNARAYAKDSAPLNQISPKLKKRGRVLHEYFYGEGLKNVNTLNQTSIGNITVEDTDWENKKVNDSRGVLNRPMTTKEHDKGYRVKREKDGSVTLRGRRGNKK